MKRILLAALLMASCPRADANVLYQQPPDPNGGFYHSSWWAPDGSNYDQYVWDRFVLAYDADVDSVAWRGAYDPPYGGDSPVVDFTVGVYGSIPGGSEPDVAHPPLVEYQVGGNAGESYAGTFGGLAMYDYRFPLPAPFHAQAGVPYWVQIEAWQWGFPGWSIAKAGSGDGSHFRCLHNNMPGKDVPTGCSFALLSGDAAFALLTRTAVGVGDAEGSPDFALHFLATPSRRGSLEVSFRLPRGVHAELALLDVSGKMVDRRSVMGSEGGPQVMRLAGGARLASGVYFARLVQGAKARVARAVIVR